MTAHLSRSGEPDAIQVTNPRLVSRLEPLGTSEEYEEILSNPEIVTNLRYPDREYSDRTWESLIARSYGTAIHSLAFAFHEPEPTINDAVVEQMYRLSIEVAAPPEAYKNLGLFLFQRNLDGNEIVDLWETYLALGTDDPQAGAIQTAVDDLKAGLSQTP